MTSLLLSLVLSVTSFAYSIDENASQWQSGKEALENCRAAGHGDQCEKFISTKDRIDASALEGCLTFKSEEDSEVKGSDSDVPQYEISRGGFARYGQCLEATKNRVFHPKALSLCSVMNDFLQHLECLQVSENNAFHSGTVDSCLKLSYQSTVQGLECLRSVRGRVLSDAQKKKCETAPFQKRAACYQSGEERELASCQTGLSKVETKLEALASSRTVGKDLKKSIAPLLEAIRENHPSQRGAQ